MRDTARDDDMAYDIPPPRQLPEPGYYYHFKHDPDGPLNNYAYYIYGAGHHTEENCRAEDAFMQVYRPLYEEAYAYRNGGLFDLRPLHMFFEPAHLSGALVSSGNFRHRGLHFCGSCDGVGVINGSFAIAASSGKCAGRPRFCHCGKDRINLSPVRSSGP